ncbi:MAG: hypothetical protein JWR75_1687 [Devosia sp.]|nr:hypothetical protein [Devosia sp.]
MHEGERRWQLRTRTADAHAALDFAVGAFDTLPSYHRYLTAMSAFRLPLERQLAAQAWPVVIGDWRPRRIADHLLHDLADFDLPIPQTLAVAGSLGTPELLGALYVLEGSTLGARVLFGRAQQLGLSAGFGARHLAVQNDGVATWRGFLGVLETAEPFDLDRVAAGSLDVFAAATLAFSV